MSFRSPRSLRDMYEPLDCDVGALPSSALTVDVLARLELAARRRGRRIRLHNASHELQELVAFMGLAGVLRWAPVEAGTWYGTPHPTGIIEDVAESVWDYPRPPRVELSPRHVRIVLGGSVIAESTRAHRVLETSHPPVYYVPLDDVVPGALEPARGGTSFCEWKGTASYLDAVGGDGRRAERAAWTYRSPAPAFDVLRDAVAFYPGRVDECTLDGELVQAQEGGFYGGWITSEIEGPFKGAPGTLGW